MADFKEAVEKCKIDISAQLEYIGICAGELFNSDEAIKNGEVYRTLSIILRKTFKTYISTQKLEWYLLDDPTKINESEKLYYTNFFEYRRAIVRLNSLIDIELEKRCNKFADPKDANAYDNLNNASKCLLCRLEELYKVEVAIKMERAKQ